MSHELDDDKNPAYLFTGIHTELLIKALSGEINLQELAKKEMANRGLDHDGNWIGFKK